MQLRLVLLPGMDGTGELFAALVAALPECFETHAVRYPADAASYPELTELVRIAVSTAKPFVLIAESFSTPLAIQYAAASPPNLKGLILCAGFATSPVEGFPLSIYSLLTLLFVRMALPRFAARRFLVGPNASRALLEAVWTAVSSVSPKVLSARLRAVLTCDVRRELSRVTVPILYIRAKHDRLVNASCSDEVQRIQPRTEVVSIDGPHLILQREPERAAEIIARYVQQL